MNLIGVGIVVFWVVVVLAVLGYVFWQAQRESKKSGLFSGIGTVEHVSGLDDDEGKPQVGRLAGQPMSFAPRPGVRERAMEERERTSPESTMESPVYLGKGSTAVSVRTVQPAPQPASQPVSQASRPPDQGPASTPGVEESGDSEEFSSTFDRVIRLDDDGRP